jgi:uncharacterized membrane protein YidH (DUF202 family)
MKKIPIFFLIFIYFLYTFGAEEGFQNVEEKVVKILGNIIRFLFSVLMILASMLFIYLGILYIFGKTKIKGETTNKAIIFVVLGIVLLITSFFIPNLIKSFIESSIR